MQGGVPTLPQKRRVGNALFLTEEAEACEGKSSRQQLGLLGCKPPTRWVRGVAPRQIRDASPSSELPKGPLEAQVLEAGFVETRDPAIHEIAGYLGAVSVELNEVSEWLLGLCAQGKPEGVQDAVDLEERSFAEALDLEQFGLGSDGKVADCPEALFAKFRCEVDAEDGIDGLKTQDLAPSLGGYF